MGGEFQNREIETLAPAGLARIQEAKLRSAGGVRLRALTLLPQEALGRRSQARGCERPSRTWPGSRSPPRTSCATVSWPTRRWAATRRCLSPTTIRVHSSTGTTGRPSFVGITRHDAAVWTDITARSLYTQDIRPQDIVLHATGLTMFVGGLPVKDALEHIGATFVPIGTGASEKAVVALQVLKCNVLHATPSYAIYLAEYVRANYGLDPQELGLERITVGAEPGGGIPAVRRRIESEWGARVTEGMGNADMAPIIFGECLEQGGMHFNAQEYIIPEIIDPDSGERLAIEEGVSGEMVYTAVDRECCPLLRFRTRDRVVVTATDVQLRPHQLPHPLRRPHRRHADRPGRQRLPLGRQGHDLVAGARDDRRDADRARRAGTQGRPTALHHGRIRQRRHRPARAQGEDRAADQGPSDHPQQGGARTAGDPAAVRYEGPAGAQGVRGDPLTRE